MYGSARGAGDRLTHTDAQSPKCMCSEQPAAAEANRVQKKKIWEACQPDLKTGGDG
jgi:hypothetical protein